MQRVKEIMKNNWDFTLYQVNEDYVLNVVFYSSRIDFSRSFRLNDNERKLDFEDFKKLSEHVRNNYELYRNREVIPTITSENSY